MPTRHRALCVRAGAVVALALLLAACTAGGQFDPTEIFNSDVFSSKKKIQGEREPLFPEGVPGAETGVPPDLVKGYQPPPEPAAVTSADAAASTAAAAEKPKPKPKPKPKVASTPPAAPHDPAFDQKPGNPVQAQPPAATWPQQQSQPAQAPWPAPAQAQTNWPAPPSSPH